VSVLLQRRLLGTISSGSSSLYKISGTNTSSGPGSLRLSSVSPSKKLKQLQDLPGNTCAKCKEVLDSESESKNA